MADNLLTTIETAITNAAGSAADYEVAKRWMALRKDYLEQKEARAVRLFWQVVLGILLGVAGTLLVQWLLGVFSRPSS